MTPYAEGSLLRAAGAAPSIDIERLAAGGVLVLAPHPDDETLGCGAALHAAVAAGHAVHVVTVTDGGGSHPGSAAWPAARVARVRRAELADALRTLGGGRITREGLDHPDQGTPTVTAPAGIRTVDRLLGIVRERRLAHLWTVWEGDPHVDHERCAALARALEARAADDGIELHTSRFPVWGRFVEHPRLDGADALWRYVPTAAGRAAKARALACHATQMSALIDDDPDGFVMPPEMQAHFLAHDELYVRRRSP